MQATENANAKAEALRALQCDYELKISNLTVKNTDLENELWDVDQKKRKLEAETRMIIKNLKEQVGKLMKENAMLQSKDTQYKHELRRKEKDYNKLQERMQQGISALNKEGKQSMEILNASKPGTRPKWKTGATGGLDTAASMDELMMLAYQGSQSRIEELANENLELRVKMQQMFARWQTEVDAASFQLREAPANENTSPKTKRMILDALEQQNAPISTKLFEMPVGMVEQELESIFKKNIQVAKSKVFLCIYLV